MPVHNESIGELRRRREQLLAEMAAVGDMRPGSLVARYRRCGKPNCRCARDGERGHGPSFSLTHGVKGKTVTKVIPREAVERTREQIAECQRFRALAQEVVAASERLCDAELRQAAGPDSEEAAKKGASRSSSRRRLRRRSKR